MRGALNGSFKNAHKPPLEIPKPHRGSPLHPTVSARLAQRQPPTRKRPDVKSAAQRTIPIAYADLLANDLANDLLAPKKGAHVVKRIKQYLIWAVLAFAFYFLLDHHFIYYQHHVRLLKKMKPSLEYTFFSLENKNPDKILAIDLLRWDGVGELMVEYDLVSEDRRWELESKYDLESGTDIQ
jgi:hypothetical protein